ncbi:putative metalloprotease CJM1_0395 family protein [Niveispirillum sp. KHB5.9]|uniref:putative metalloprotease CJM1_0395 family protein n=1 Tax=Niveispirillum sp. KHB5.9 TaxID=3400269 RepID=UPI003A8A1DF5
MTAISGISSALFAVPGGAKAARGGGGGQAASSSPPGAPAAEKDLTEEQQTQLRELKKTDAEVRTHEQAHKTAGGPYAGGIQLEYTTGPDGRRYATAGEVPIDVSPVRNNPEATITKMEVVKRAALAPQAPSPQDRAVAAQADATKAQAQTELRQSRNGEGTEGEGAETGGGGGAANDRSAARRATESYNRAASATAQPGFSFAISA